MAYNQDVYERYISGEHPTTFSSPGAILRYQKTPTAIANQEGTVPDKDVRATLAQNFAYTTHRDYRRPRRYNLIYVHRLLQQLMLDLADFSSLQSFNDGICFVLFAICTWSKFLWVRCLRQKTAEETLAAIKDIVESCESGGKTPESIYTDRGYVSVCVCVCVLCVT